MMSVVTFAAAQLLRVLPRSAISRALGTLCEANLPAPLAKAVVGTYCRAFDARALRRRVRCRLSLAARLSPRARAGRRRRRERSRDRGGSLAGQLHRRALRAWALRQESARHRRGALVRVRARRRRLRRRD